MALYRHFLLILATAFFVTSAQAQSTPVVAIDGDFRALVETSNRVLGLDHANQVFESTDGGQSFALLSTLPTDKPEDIYYSMSALGTTVIAVGTDGLIARSVDEGANWTASVITDFLSGDLKTVAGRSGSPNTWISAGGDGTEGVILLSTDDGATWAESSRLTDLSYSGSVWTGSAWLVCGLNESSFEGVINRSTDNGANWSLATLPNGTAPLLALASDGVGNVVAVGEGGVILHSNSNDDGVTFVQIGGVSLLSEDLNVVVATGPNKFSIGGGGKSILNVQAESASILRGPVGGASDVEALLSVDGTVLVGGAFETTIERSIPFDLKIVVSGSSFQLSIEQSLSGKTYTLETSTNLVDWHPVANSGLSGLNGPLEWTKSQNGQRLFWRVEEF